MIAEDLSRYLKNPPQAATTTPADPHAAERRLATKILLTAYRDAARHGSEDSAYWRSDVHRAICEADDPAVEGDADLAYWCDILGVPWAAVREELLRVLDGGRPNPALLGIRVSYPNRL